MYRKKKLIQFLLLVAITLIISFFSLRGVLLRYMFQQKTKYFSERYQASIQAGSLRFCGLRTVEFQQLIIKPYDKDTLAVIGRLELRISLPNLLRLRLRISNLLAGDIHINLVKTATGESNYLFLFRKNSIHASDTTDKNNQTLQQKVNYKELAGQVIDRLFGYIPKEIRFTRFLVTASLMGEEFSLSLPDIHIHRQAFAVDFYLAESSKTTTIHAEGAIDRSSKNFKIRIYPLDSLPVSVPYIQHRWNTLVAFDTLAFSLDSAYKKGGQWILRGNSHLTRFTIANERISHKPVYIENGMMDYRLIFSDYAIEFDSLGFIQLNKLGISPWIKWEKNPDRILSLKITKPGFDAGLLFSSLPAGLFENLKGIETRGKFTFRLFFNVNIDKPDQIALDGGLTSEDFEIVKYGQTDLGYINRPFEYPVYENGEEIKRIQIDSLQPQYLTLDKISPLLVSAIITSEDGAYFSHKGFLPEEIKNAISTNIKRKKFARGGSTITMQLVKNIFLSRDKTITRKLEEALIVWLIENKNICSKQRMLEIYLNIVEMGPDIYGVGEGARFYFAEDQLQLSLPQALFMSAVIPRPKKFYYMVDTAGYLKPEMEGYYRFVSGKMLEHGLIGQAEYDSLKPAVRITGRALQFMNKPEPGAAEDSVVIFTTDSL